MPDIEYLLRAAIDHPVERPRPVAEVAKRARKLRYRRARRQAVVALAVFTLAGGGRWMISDQGVMMRPAADPPPPRQLDVVPGGPSGEVDVVEPDKWSKGPAGGAAALTPSGAVEESCARGNGGATAPGVTDDRIKLYMTATPDAPGASLVLDALTAVKAVVAEVNNGGGICGRTLDLHVGYGFRPPPNDVLAAIAGPMQWELDRYITDGHADRRGIPIVGADGLTSAQFQSPWVWPAGAPVGSLVRIAVSHAYSKYGARSFALVHDSRSDYGTSAAAAFRDYVATLPGASVRVVQGLGAGDSYVSEIGRFNSECFSGRCDAVVWATGPGQARQWINQNPSPARLVTSALTYEIGTDAFALCPHTWTTCRNLLAWDAFMPPVHDALHDADVAEYRQIVGDNLFPPTQAAYVGARMLVAAIAKAGPSLTRDSLRRALDELRYTSGLVGGFSFGPHLPDGRAGNHMARPFVVEDGELIPSLGWMADPMPGRFP